MNPDEIIEKVRLIETHFPVTELVYKERLVWPLFRSYLVIELFLNDSPVIKKHTISHSKIAYGNIVKSLLIFPYKLYKLFRLKQNYRNEILKVCALSPEALVYAYPPETYIDEIGGGKYSRFLDPYYEVIRKKYRTVNLRPVNEDQPAPADHFHAILPVNVQYYLDYVMIRNDFFNSRKQSKDMLALARIIKDLNTFLKKYSIPFYIDSYLLKKTDTAFVLEQFYSEILREAKPKVVFMECFYDTYKFALVAACKQNGVRSVDIQHGGVEDPMYLPWDTRYGNIGYIPDFLWCWSEEDKNIVQRYNGKDACVLKPVVGGNMWMKKFRNSEIGTEENGYDTLLNRSRLFEKAILFSLQWAYELPADLIRLIEGSTTKWFWMIRLHPLTKKELRDKILAQLSAYPNVETQLSSSLLLYRIFSIADVQVTFSSTTVFEALSFDVQTILIHPHGRDYYKDLIRDGVAFYAERKEEIMPLIEKINRHIFPKEKAARYQIQCSEAEAVNALDQIVD